MRTTTLSSLSERNGTTHSVRPGYAEVEAILPVPLAAVRAKVVSHSMPSNLEPATQWTAGWGIHSEVAPEKTFV